MQQQRDRRLFSRGGAGQQFNVLLEELEIGRFDDMPVDADPASLDIQFGLAPGTADLLGEAFGQAYRVGHGRLGCFGRRNLASHCKRLKAVGTRLLG